MDPRGALAQYVGFSAFRPGQEAALSQVLAGRDALVLMLTGSAPASH